MFLFQWTPYEREGVNGWSMESIVEGLVFLSFLSVTLTAIYPIFLDRFLSIHRTPVENVM
jgi:hypothetical protein